MFRFMRLIRPSSGKETARCRSSHSERPAPCIGTVLAYEQGHLSPSDEVLVSKDQGGTSKVSCCESIRSGLKVTLAKCTFALGKIV